MWSITLKLMRKTKRMLIPAGIAIMIGTAFIASTFLFGNAMNDSLTRQLTAMFGNANYAVSINSSDLSDKELNEAYSSTVAASYADRALVFADGQIVADVNKPTADQMSELLMKEREAATMNVASARHSR